MQLNGDVLSSLLLLIITGTILAMTADADDITVQSSRLKITFREDLNGLSSIIDQQTGRDYADSAAPPVGLYGLSLGKSHDDCVRLGSREATQRRYEVKGDTLMLHFTHEGKYPLEVRCEVSGKAQEPFIRWRISVINRSPLPLLGIAFPRALCKIQLGDSLDDDAIVYPLHEGTLLCKPAKYFKKDTRVGHPYPGSFSAQFLYFYDSDGGFYMAAEDGAGHRKTSSISCHENALALAFGHGFPSESRERIHLPYDVVWTCGGGTWYDGADIYKQWAEKQSWCGKKLTERDVPEWLTKGNVFLNYSPRQENVFYPASAAIGTFKRYHDFFQTPVVGVPFGWEKHGPWIGPDYFPPFGGEENYREICRGIKERGDHLLMYLSGFRWGVRRPLKEKKDKPRTYTDFDGTMDFEERGRPAAAVKADGSLDFRQPPWADNYTLCVGSKLARDILAECYRKIFDWGVAGVDLDQNVGGAASGCFSTEHGHPPGSGVWIHEAMTGFLSEVRAEAKAKHPDCFMGIEEPCEIYNPYLDIYHGRAFTDTRWPANAPGSVSIPLYAYLYHEYIMGYAGWCDEGFSPMGDVRMGLARSFIFGMQPGVRIQKGIFIIKDGEQNEQLHMLRRVAKLVRKAAKYLMPGRMLREPKVSGSPALEAKKLSRWQRRHLLPIPWNVVQATAWMSPTGDVCYAVANLSEKSVRPQIEIAPNGMKAERFTLRLLKPESEEILHESVQLPMKVTLEMEPWEVCCVEQLEALRKER